MGEWKDIPFADAVTVNPQVPMTRGKVYPFVDMKAIDPGSRSVSESEQREFKSGGARFLPDDTLMARITPCLENGKIARYVPHQVEPGPAFGSTEFIVVRGREGITDNDYAYYLTKWPVFRDFAVSQMTGSSGRQRVPVGALSGLDVPVPPLPQQKAIAHILGTLDDKIELNRRMNETLEGIARAIFKSWFVDFDPVRAKAEGRDTGLPKEIEDLFPDGLEDSELGEIPKGWPLVAVSSLLDINPRLSLSKGAVSRYVDMKALPITGFSVTEVIDKEFKGGAKYQQHDVLLARITPCLENGKTALVDFLDQGQVGFGSTEFIVLRGTKGCDREFVYCLARDQRFRRHCIASMVGSSGRQRVQNACFDTYLFPEVPAAVLNEFAKRVRASFETITRNSRELIVLSNLRNVLLPSLLSGTMPISDAGTLVEGVG